MPNSKTIVINTSPLLALSAALGDLTLLQRLYSQVFVPFEVCQEILSGPGFCNPVTNVLNADSSFQRSALNA